MTPNGSLHEPRTGRSNVLLDPGGGSAGEDGRRRNDSLRERRAGRSCALLDSGGAPARDA